MVFVYTCCTMKNINYSKVPVQLRCSIHTISSIGRLRAENGFGMCSELIPGRYIARNYKPLRSSGKIIVSDV